MVPLRRLLVAGALLLGLFVPGLAQISPGDLSRAHAGLEGVKSCVKCHEFGGGSEVSSLCRSCHAEIDRSLAERRGLHGKESWSSCAECHPEHGGRGFELIEWPEGWPESFEHERTGWKLEGAHARTTCAKCHTLAFQRAPIADAIMLADRSRSYLGLLRECASCHEDQHEGRFGTDCARCHEASTWKDVKEEGFDHSRTRYPLEGRHAALECGACHDPEKAWGRKPAFGRCTDCHADAHAGGATLRGRRVDCAACHDVHAGFEETTYQRAWHADTRFPLEGEHAELRCGQCHVGSRSAPAGPGLGLAGVLLRPRSERCEDCHADAHAGQFAGRSSATEGCRSCHGVEGFRPSTFGVDRHDGSDFPLVGAHRGVACARCHGVDRGPELPEFPAKEIVGRAGMHFTMGKLACEDCHRDPHEGRYGLGGERPQEEGCLSCHDQERFRPSRFDTQRHADFGRPLEGAHATLPCFECHQQLSDPDPLRLVFDAGREECSACHADTHRGQLADETGSTRCEACHDQASFARALGFDHERDARFQLRGAHARVACSDCHPEERGPEGERFVRYKPLPTACRDCHR